MTARVGHRRTLWHRTGPRIETDPSPPGDIGATHSGDAVVVGAGITGLASAVMLARSGMRVDVLESADVGAATTGGTTGKLSLLQGTVLSEIRQHAGDDVLHAYAEANRQGQAWLRRLLGDRGVEVEERTAFTLAQTDTGVAALERELQASLDVGIEAERTAEAGVPFPVAGALRLPGQAQLHPMRVLATLAEELRERGGRILTGCRVTGASVEGDAVALTTSAGELTTGIVILATGTPILDRGMFFARIEPTRSLVAAYRLDEELLPEGMHVTVDDPYRSLRTAEGESGERLLLVGGGAHVTGRGGSTLAMLEGVDAWTHQHFPGSERVVSWGAQDYRSHCRVPFAGPLMGGGERIFAATGFNAWGMTNSIAAAQAMVSQVLDGRNDWAQTLREHGQTVASAAAAVRANAAVAGRLAGGWLPLDYFSRACDPARLQEGQGAVSRVGLSPVATSRVDGDVRRVSAVCPHLGGILAWNDLERTWDCPLHGSRFAADGTRLEGPAVDDLEPK